jgi:hypothetical protein
LYIYRTKAKKMTTKSIIEDLKNGLRFGNHNTDFIFTIEGEMLMCEYAKDCKYTSFSSIEKFARRILRFSKIGY